MSLIDKMNMLAQRRRELSQKMETRADELMTRYDAMPARIDGAFDKHLAQIDAEEKQLQEMDEAIDRLTNGNPTSGGSEPPGSGTGA